MPRIRSLKPEIWKSEQVGGLSVLARLTFIGLISLADDHGRGIAEMRFLMGHLHTYAPDVSTKDLSLALDELTKNPEKGAPLVVLYEFDVKQYYWLTGFKKHQSINRPSGARYPEPPAIEVKPPVTRRISAKSVAPATNGHDSALPLLDKPEVPVEPKPKTKQQLIIEAFAANRGVDLTNKTICNRFFSTNGAAAIELEGLCGGDLKMALQALTDIARYLDLCVEEHEKSGGKEGIAEWRHMEALNNNFLKWKSAYDKKGGGNNG